MNTPNRLKCGKTPPRLCAAVGNKETRGPWPCLLLCLLFCSPARAQSFSIDWHKISSGGGTSSNGQYSISGAIGQHDASAPMTGGSYSLACGYWSIIRVVQTDGLPNLSIAGSGGSVILSWTNTVPCVLQQNANISQTNGWTANGSAVTTENGVNRVVISHPDGNLFFRLAK